jgi:hypothetical protein
MPRYVWHVGHGSGAPGFDHECAKIEKSIVHHAPDVKCHHCSMMPRNLTRHLSTEAPRIYTRPCVQLRDLVTLQDLAGSTKIVKLSSLTLALSKEAPAARQKPPSCALCHLASINEARSGPRPPLPSHVSALLPLCRLWRIPLLFESVFSSNLHSLSVFCADWPSSGSGGLQSALALPCMPCRNLDRRCLC